MLISLLGDMREALRINLSESVVEAIIDMMCRLGIRHEIPFRLRPALRDPDDEFVLDIAVAGQAEFIVTYNLRDFGGAEAYGVRPVTPSEFLRIIGVWR